MNIILLYGFVIIEDVFLFYNETVKIRNVKKISILKSPWVILNNKKHALLFICSRKFGLFIPIAGINCLEVILLNVDCLLATKNDD